MAIKTNTDSDIFGVLTHTLPSALQPKSNPKHSQQNRGEGQVPFTKLQSIFGAATFESLLLSRHTTAGTPLIPKTIERAIAASRVNNITR